MPVHDIQLQQMAHDMEDKTPNVETLVETLDKFHYHEISDRCHIINSMIDDFILDHPACSKQAAERAKDAQRHICEIMNIVAVEEEGTC